MFENAMHNIASGDPSTIGLILGFCGALLVTIFGLPSIPLLSEGSYVEIQITTKMKVYTWISRVGLLFIAIGFIFQLAGIARVP
jgi:uncharacterized membrane protein YGL010W